MAKQEKLNKKLNEYQPEKDLELFCYALVSENVRGNKEKAQVLSGVDKGKFYYAYKTSEDFRHWYSELCFSILGENEAIPPYALLGAIVKKDVQAIRTYYELKGRLKNKINLEHTMSENLIEKFSGLTTDALIKKAKELISEIQRPK